MSKYSGLQRLAKSHTGIISAIVNAVSHSVPVIISQTPHVLNELDVSRGELRNRVKNTNLAPMYDTTTPDMTDAKVSERRPIRKPIRGWGVECRRR